MFVSSSSQTKKCAPDLILNQILPLIDGVRYVRKIADIAGVDLEDARVAFRSLLIHGVIAKIDIFQFSNMYRVTSKVQELASSKDLQERCVMCVCPDLTRTMAPESSNTLGPDRHVTKRMYQTIFRTYCSFRGGVNVEDVLKSQHILSEDENQDGDNEIDGSDRIDPNRLVVFGVVCGFLRRVHEYPLMSSKARDIATTYARDIARDESQSLVVSMFDGTNSMDSICVRCFVSRSTVLRYISSLGSDCVVVPK